MAWFERLVDELENTDERDLSRKDNVVLAGWIVSMAIGLVLTIIGAVVSVINSNLGTTILACSGLCHSIGLSIMVGYAMFSSR
jgi:hypothetical protein